MCSGDKLSRGCCGQPCFAVAKAYSDGAPPSTIAQEVRLRDSAHQNVMWAEILLHRSYSVLSDASACPVRCQHPDCRPSALAPSPVWQQQNQHPHQHQQVPLVHAAEVEVEVDSVPYFVPRSPSLSPPPSPEGSMCTQEDADSAADDYMEQSDTDVVAQALLALSSTLNRGVYL